jgi:hypothetical protein
MFKEHDVITLKGTIVYVYAEEDTYEVEILREGRKPVIISLSSSDLKEGKG